MELYRSVMSKGGGYRHLCSFKYEQASFRIEVRELIAWVNIGTPRVLGTAISAI